MKQVGQLLKDGRVSKGYSLSDLEAETKIRKSFLEAIEASEWDKLPEFPVVSGFIKNIASSLDIDRNQAVALLRRDYPPKNVSVNPKPDVSDKFTWSPRITFLAGVLIIAVLLLGYLGFQYIKFISPPDLVVERPKEEERVTESNLTVEGRTSASSRLEVNNQPVLVEDDGKFKTEIEVFEGTTEIVVKAISRSGKETIVHRPIKVDLSSHD